MAGIVTDEGDRFLGANALQAGVASSPNLVLKLFTNNFTPAITDSTVGSYTECAFGGYVGVPLINSSWATTFSAGVPQIFTYPTVTFTFTGGGTLYGYYLYDVNSGYVWWAAAFTSPVVIPGFGGSWSLQIQMQFNTCP